MGLTAERRSEIARKAADTRRRRKLEASLDSAYGDPKNVVTTESVIKVQNVEDLEQLDLSLPQQATRFQVRRALQGFARTLKEMVKETRPTKSKLTPVKSEKESIVVLFSDTHFGKIITDEEDKTRVLFNPEIGARRASKVAEEACRFALERNADEIVVLMGGDMIDGEGIYFTQAMHIEQNAVEQVKNTAKGFFELLRRMNKVTGLPVRVVGCPGNHGRTSKTADELTNWDQMIYIILDLLCDQIPESISIEYPNSRQFILVEVKGQRILLRHKAKRGTSPSPAAQWQNWMLQHDYDVAACGHWHTPAIEYVLGCPVFRSGSLCGKDDFAESLGLGDAASQWVWGMKEGDPMTFARLVTFEED